MKIKKIKISKIQGGTARIEFITDKPTPFPWKDTKENLILQIEMSSIDRAQKYIKENFPKVKCEIK